MFFGNKEVVKNSVASIVSDLKEKVLALRALSEDERQAASDFEEQAKAAMLLRDEAVKEADTADNIAAKIDALIS